MKKQNFLKHTEMHKRIDRKSRAHRTVAVVTHMPGFEKSTVARLWTFAGPFGPCRPMAIGDYSRRWSRCALFAIDLYILNSLKHPANESTLVTVFKGSSA